MVASRPLEVAIDGKDKISALASDANDHELDPNYETTPEIVFTGSTIWLLTRVHLSTLILHIAGIGISRRLSALPSCVLDWTVPCPNTVFGAVAQTVRYCASGNTSSSNDVLYDAQQKNPSRYQAA